MLIVHQLTCFCLQFRDRTGPKKNQKRGTSENVEDPEPPKKKGNQKDFYGKHTFIKIKEIYKLYNLVGVDNNRFLGKKTTAPCVSAVSKTNDDHDTEAREAVYEENREQIQYMFR